MKADSNQLVACILKKSAGLAQLDEMLQEFMQNPRRSGGKIWVRLLLRGLGLSLATAGERNKTTRQAMFKLAKSESAGHITLNAMKKFAQTVDCEFVYGFVPQNHDSFAEYVVEKTTPLVEHPTLVRPLRGLQRSVVVASRIEQYLAQPTGRDKMWGAKKAQKRNYSWLSGLQYPNSFFQFVKRREI